MRRGQGTVGAHAVVERMQRAALRAAADPLGVAVFVVAISLAAGAFGQAAAPIQEEGWGDELSNELMSPWCPGFALPDCSSGYAKQLHAWILEQEKLGRPRAEVEAEVLARYGEKIRQAPKAEGRAWFAYLIPAAAFLAGLSVVVAFLRHQGGRSREIENPPPSRPAIDAASEARLSSRVDAELAEYDAAHGE